MPNRLTGAKHQDTKQFYKDLPEMIQEKKAEIEELQENVNELKKEVRIYNARKTVTEVVDGFAKRKENKQKEAQILTLKEKVNELFYPGTKKIKPGTFKVRRCPKRCIG